MFRPRDTFQPASVSDLHYHSSDLAFIRHNPPSFLGDRREVAYDELHQQLLLRGQASLEVLSPSELDRQRFSRLLNNEHVDCCAMIDYACTRSVPQAADNAPCILVLSDGCNVGLKSAQGRVKARGGLLGVLNDGDAPGLMLHASLAIDVDRFQVVGLADTIMFSRSKKLAGKIRHKATGGKMRGDKRLTRKEKESYAWELGATNSRRLLEAKGYHRRIYVHDAGSDDKTLISRLLEFKNDNSPHLGQGVSQDDFVIRLRDYQRIFYKGYRRDDKPDLCDIPWLDANLVRTSKGGKLKKTKLGMLLEQH